MEQLQTLIVGQHLAFQETGVKFKEEETMGKALDIVKNLDDVQAVKMLKQIYRDIFKSIPYEKIKQNVEGKESVSILRKLDPDIMKQNIDPDHSVELTRNMLLCFAGDKNLSALVIDAWKKVENDDELMIGMIITLGIIVNLTLFMATSEVEFEFKGAKIKKGTANADQIKAVLSPLTELIKKIVPGIV